MGRANILCKRAMNGNTQRISGSIVGDASIQSLQNYLCQTAEQISVFDLANATIEPTTIISLSGESNNDKTLQGITKIKVTMHAKKYSSSLSATVPTDACISVEGTDVNEALNTLKAEFDKIFSTIPGIKYYIKLFTYYIETEVN